MKLQFHRFKLQKRAFPVFLALTMFSYSGPETELVALINHERQAHNLPSVSINWELARLARYRAEEMQMLEFFSFESPAYDSPKEMLARFGMEFTEVGASIAVGRENAEDVFNAWMTSNEYRNKILNPEFTAVGVGFTRNANGKAYWTLLLMSNQTSCEEFV